MTLTDEQRRLCDAIEHEDLDQLVELLSAGTSLDFVIDGLSPLHLALDVESDGAAQRGGPTHVDVTAALLCFGAHPDDTYDGRVSVTARHNALLSGHDLAVRLFELVHPEQR